mmetsp:Transcript_1494/g.9140  ORF Transcript_1494/g.9140 Transcript_1494/m.9140 type:complete len:276 (-) Transcript_1494:287-1114(-)
MLGHAQQDDAYAPRASQLQERKVCRRDGSQLGPSGTTDEGGTCVSSARSRWEWRARSCRVPPRDASVGRRPRRWTGGDGVSRVGDQRFRDVGRISDDRRDDGRPVPRIQAHPCTSSSASSTRLVDRSHRCMIGTSSGFVSSSHGRLDGVVRKRLDARISTRCFFPSFPSLFFFRHRQSVGRTRVLHDPSCSFSSSRFRRFASTSSSWVWLIFFFICVRSILLGDGGFIDVRAVSSLWPMLCGPRPVVSGFVSACWICRRPSADDRIWRGRIFPCR